MINKGEYDNGVSALYLDLPFGKTGNYGGITASISLGIKTDKRTFLFISPMYKRILFESQFVNDADGNSYKMYLASFGLNAGICINFGGQF